METNKKNDSIKELTTDFEYIQDIPEIEDLPIPISKEQAKIIRLFYKNEKPKFDNQLKSISIKSQLDPIHKFTDLYQLVYNPELLFNSAGTISSKIRATTKGINDDTSDKVDIKRISKISDLLKNNKFKFKPIKRIYIDKTGKNPKLNQTLLALNKIGKLDKAKAKELKARPLGILTFSDKVVAESIRVILTSIYEPEFKKTNSNFGFRPKLSPKEAINHHTEKAKSHDFMIEADIAGAFDNVNHDILINILSKKISDTRFLKLIKNSLTCGIHYSNTTEISKIGTTQGSSLSPLLYNIYFHEFDKFIHNQFSTLINRLNSKEKRITTPFKPTYTKITKAKKLPVLKQLQSNVNPNWENYKQNPSAYELALSKYRTKLLEWRKLDNLQKKTNRFNFGRRIIRYTYTRYADDWIFSTNASRNYTIRFKNIFQAWILQHLKLDLSETKTKITCLTGKSEKACFLGFNLVYFSSRSSHVAEYGRKIKTRTNLILRKRTSSFKPEKEKTFILKKNIAHPRLIVSFDHNRVLNRLKEARFLKKKRGEYFGQRKAEWTTLLPNEIINRYNQIIRGYLNYYCINLTYPTELNYLCYLLQYSCLHTLANKFNTTLGKIIKKFGKAPTINFIIKTEKKTKTGTLQTISTPKSIKLIDWSMAKDIMQSSKNHYKIQQNINTELPIDEICSVKINGRTRYKLTRHCCICGNTENIQYHHVRHIKVNKTEGFLQVLNNLNRKQIPVCQKCHTNIHQGKYDSLKLTDLFDERLIIL
jgi:retron-type reverse transcriptase